MRSKTLFTLLAVAAGFLVVGCGSGNNAAEIAQSYGILNRCDLQPKIASIIQSGQADKMIRDGAADVRYRVQNSGDKKILVKEYLIEGEVYRVEVRKTFDPLKNIPTHDIRYGHYEQGLDKDYICWGQLSSVICCLRHDSYKAEYDVAYRAWRDMSGNVHPVKVENGVNPSYDYSANALNLTLRTTMWPMITTWVQSTNGKGNWLLLGDGMAGRDMKDPIPFVNLSLAGKF